VSLVARDSGRVQQFPEFLLKADHAVMGFLACDVRRVAKAIAAWGNTYPALSGLAAKLGDNLNPGRLAWASLFRPFGAESTALWAESMALGG